MKRSFQKGLCFGMTSGVITTLGLMIGLDAGTASRGVVLGGILTIAIADACSDALGMHLSEEASGKDNSTVWEITFVTAGVKFLTALTFALPFMLKSLSQAVLLSASWGFFLLAILSYFIARFNREAAWKVIGEHLLIAGLVVTVSHYLGHFVAYYFQ